MYVAFHQVSLSLTKNLVAVELKVAVHGLNCMFCYKINKVLYTTTFFVNEEKLNNGYTITSLTNIPKLSCVCWHTCRRRLLQARSKVMPLLCCFSLIKKEFSTQVKTTFIV